MATTTFSGPIKAGTIRNTTGTTLGSDYKNVGQVVMSQSEAVTQASGATTIIIPANSQILTITLSVNVIWTGGATTLGVGTTASATAFTAADAVAGGALGLIDVTSAALSANATRVNNLADVGSTDVKLLITSTNTGDGTGYLTVTYAQNNNLA